MSAIDRAFIRAFEPEASRATPTLWTAAAAKVAPPTADPPRPQVAEATHAPVGETTRHAAAPAAPASLASGPHFRVGSMASQPAATSRGPSTSDRRPLSSFAPPERTVEARFRPALEVDAFRWPTVCDALVASHAPAFDQAVLALLAADDAGRSLVGVGGASRGVGSSTIVACLARLLVGAGKTVAIVDGDFVTAGLAATLGLGVEIGWEDVLAGRVPLAEAVIHSLADQFAILPLASGGVPAAEKLDAIHASVTAGVLRYHYDIILFDLGALADPVQGPIARRVARQCRLDGALIAAEPGDASGERKQQLAQAAPEIAAVCLGVIENQLAAA